MKTRNLPPTTSATAGYRAVEVLYHAYLTGLILLTVTRRGAPDAAELVLRTFRRQQLEKFLPGLEKLGLCALPDAVASAQYHYLSNHLGGVKVEYVYESDRKAWVRYPPPRWIFSGTAICGVPSEVSRAMLRGWHAHNGVALGNPRLGFVCTGQTVDGQPGLEGYYCEHDHELSPEERLRFSPGERCPDFDPAAAPRLVGADWPPERLEKVRRNYAMEYIKSLLPEVVALFGPGEGGHLGALAARLIAMQHYDEVASLLAVAPGGAEGFARLMAGLARAQGDEVTWEAKAGEAVVRQRGWRLMRGVGHLHPAVFEAWNGLWQGLLAVHDRHLGLEVTGGLDLDGEGFEWRLRRRSR